MADEGLKIVITGFWLLFFAFGWFFRKRVSYIFCPLEKYAGRVNKGKSVYVGLIHLLLSLTITLGIFTFLDNIKILGLYFEDNFVRIAFVIIVWFIWLFIFGLLIEMYLVRTDSEYKNWKHDFLNNKK